MRDKIREVNVKMSLHTVLGRCEYVKNIEKKYG